MSKTLAAILGIFFSMSSFSAVDFKEKQARVENLLKLVPQVSSLSLEAYLRELQYEKQGLGLNSRATIEANLLLDKMRNQVVVAYNEAIKVHKVNQLARDEVKMQIEKDIKLFAPELRDELMHFALSTLDAIDSGALSRKIDLKKTESYLLKEIKNRHEYLNQVANSVVPTNSATDPIKDADRTEYNSKAELIESLTSDRDNTRWISRGYQSIKTSLVKSKGQTIPLQLKVTFLGATIEGGPTINFSQDFSTYATIMAEGLNPIILKDGNFDYWSRDEKNKVTKTKEGKDQKRYAFFTCDANLDFMAQYSGSGGFNVMGVGGTVSYSEKFVHSVSVTSRRIVLPEFVEGKSVTMEYISQLCHHDFLKAKLKNGPTVRSTLEEMMKNLVSATTFSHPKTKCIQDEQCYEWFNREIVSLHKNKNYPRCREESGREKYFSCQLRGLEGQNCPVIENGKRTSSGQWEYTCDEGLTCVKYQDLTYTFGTSLVWTYAKGKCQVNNKNTYKNPLDAHRY